MSQELPLMRRVGISQRNSHEKAVELRFRQSKRTQLLVGILGGDHEERLGQRMSRGIRTDLTLLHGFQQSALGPRAGPIDFVRQQQLGEDRSLPEMKLLA